MTHTAAVFLCRAPGEADQPGRVKARESAGKVNERGLRFCDWPPYRYPRLPGRHRQQRSQVAQPWHCPGAGRPLVFPSWPSAPGSASERASRRRVPAKLPSRRRGALPETARRGGRKVAAPFPFPPSGQCEVARVDNLVLSSTQLTNTVYLSPCLPPTQWTYRCGTPACGEPYRKDDSLPSLLLQVPVEAERPDRTREGLSTLEACLATYFAPTPFEARWAPHHVNFSSSLVLLFQSGTRHLMSTHFTLSLAAPGARRATRARTPSCSTRESPPPGTSWASS